MIAEIGIIVYMFICFAFLFTVFVWAFTIAFVIFAKIFDCLLNL